VKSHFLTNVYGVLFTIFTIIYLFGWAGLLGIIVLVGMISFRVFFRKTIEAYDEELGKETSSRVRQTVDVFGIIKFIKVAAL
jgi:uncharacterized membrane protein